MQHAIHCCGGHHEHAAVARSALISERRLCASKVAGSRSGRLGSVKGWFGLTCLNFVFVSTFCFGIQHFQIVLSLPEMLTSVRGPKDPGADASEARPFALFCLRSESLTGLELIRDRGNVWHVD